ncbi:MAG: putative replication initiation protein [Cressdnaviricota sp.]|nr:MAG: putative replication initiation protein [Cressdnaviricota sp.]
MTELKLVIQKLLTKKWITTYVYTYEQRSETSEHYKGFHCHILLYRKDKSNSQMMKEIRNTCKHICDISNTHILNFRNLKTDADVEKAYNYITGIKADSNKHTKQMIDKEFRKHYYLKEYYKKDPDNLISLITKEDARQQEEIHEENINWC